MKRVCREINMAYDPQMIRQYEPENTMTKNPRGQLSADRIKQPIDTSAIGRWRKILSDEDVAAFLKGCGGLGVYESRGY